MMGLIFLMMIVAAVYLAVRSLRDRQDEATERMELRSLQHAGGIDGDVDSEEKEYLLNRWRNRHSGKSSGSTVSESRYRQFFTKNKCDYRCGAESQYTAYKDGCTLTFCSHHTRAYRDKLAQSGFVLIPSSPSELAAS